MIEGHDEDLVTGAARVPKLPPGRWMPLNTAWGKSVPREERDAIDKEDGTAEKLASGEIFEDSKGRRWQRIGDAV